MRASKAKTITGPAGTAKFTREVPGEDYKRRDFFRDLKKVAKKRDRPSQSDR